MKVFDYKCDTCLFAEERFVRDADDEVLCRKCGNQARRMPCAPKLDWDALAKGDNASPEAIRHFERKRKQKLEQEQKHRE